MTPRRDRAGTLFGSSATIRLGPGSTWAFGAVLAVHALALAGIAQLRPATGRSIDPITVTLIEAAHSSSAALRIGQEHNFLRSAVHNALASPQAHAPTDRPVPLTNVPAAVPVSVVPAAGTEFRNTGVAEGPSASAAMTPAPVRPDAVVTVPSTAALTPVRFDASYLNNPSPAYPALARRMGEHGRVILRVYVNAEGLPERIETGASSGSIRLDLAAQSAVGNWRFVPARQGTQAIGAWVLVPINFSLENS